MIREDWPFPPWFAPVMVLLFGGVILGLSFMSGSRNVEPPKVTGCYTSLNGPNILVDQHLVRVLQPEPLNVPYKLEYIKGWSLTVERWLDFQRDTDGSFTIVPGPDFGEVLFVSREGVVSDPNPGFDLVNHGDGTFVHYSPSGDACRS